MKKGLAIGILGLLLVATLLIGTSATFRDYRAQRSTHIAVVADDVELVDLRPGQPYAYINEIGKLTIDFSVTNPNYPWEGEGQGLSPQSRYNFDHVFYVSNHLWENVTIVVEVISPEPGLLSFYNPDGLMYGVGTTSRPYNSDTAIGDVCFYLLPGEELGVGLELAPDVLGDHYNNITIKAWPAGEEPIDCGGVLK
jgi:hypothetical protein